MCYYLNYVIIIKSVFILSNSALANYELCIMYFNAQLIHFITKSLSIYYILRLLQSVTSVRYYNVDHSFCVIAAMSRLYTCLTVSLPVCLSSTRNAPRGILRIIPCLLINLSILPPLSANIPNLTHGKFPKSTHPPEVTHTTTSSHISQVKCYH